MPAFAVIVLAVIAAAIVITFMLRRGERVPRSYEENARRGCAPSPPSAFDSSVPTPDALDLVSGYSLQERETGFFGRWWETRVEGRRVAFYPSGLRLVVWVGNFNADDEQLTEVYLDRVPEGQTVVKGSRSLKPLLGDRDLDLAQRFMLNASVSGDHALQIDEVRTALRELSPAVVEVMIYENVGVELGIDPQRAAASSVRSDVAAGLALVAALERGRAAVKSPA